MSVNVNNLLLNAKFVKVYSYSATGSSRAANARRCGNHCHDRCRKWKSSLIKVKAITTDNKISKKIIGICWNEGELDLWPNCPVQKVHQNSQQTDIQVHSVTKCPLFTFLVDKMKSQPTYFFFKCPVLQRISTHYKSKIGCKCHFMSRF